MLYFQRAHCCLTFRSFSIKLLFESVPSHLPRSAPLEGRHNCGVTRHNNWWEVNGVNRMRFDTSSELVRHWEFVASFTTFVEQRKQVL